MKRFVGARALVAASLLAFVCFAISAAGAGAAAPTGTKVLAAKPLIPHGAKALGAVSPTATVSAAVVLQPRDPGALTRFIAQVLGVKPLQNGATAPDLKTAFGL